MKRTARIVVENLACVAVYLIAADVLNGLGNASSALVAAPSGLGVAVAAAVVLGTWCAPGVAVGVVLSCVVERQPLLVCLLMPVVVVAAAILAAKLLQRAGFERAMRRVSDVMSFLEFGVMVPSLLVSLLSSGLVAVAGGLGSLSFGSAWFASFAVTLSGTVVTGSFVLVVSRASRSSLWSWRMAQIITVTLALAAFSGFVVSSHSALPTVELLSLLVLAGVYGQKGTVIGSLALTGLDALLTSAGSHPFGGGTDLVRATQGSLFMSAATVAALFVAAAFSERHLAETANGVLEETAQELAEAQNLGEIGSFVVDLRTGSAVLSERAALILDFMATVIDDYLGHWLQMIVEEDRPLAERKVKQLVASGQNVSFAVRANRRDGAIQWIETRIRLERDENSGAPVRAHCTVQDITPMRLAQLRGVALFESAPYPIVVIDEAGTVVRSNLSAARLFEVEDGDLKDRALGSLVELPATADLPLSSWWVAAAADADGNGLELWGMRDSGSRFPVEAFVSEMPSERGTQYSIGLRDVTKPRELVDLLNFQARHDPLTELPNRLMFVDELEQALARARTSGKPLAVIFADLDNFKSVNDTGGHAVGDLALAETAARVMGGIREGDLLARFGGDEYVVLCEDVANARAAQTIAKRIADAVAGAPFVLEGRTYDLSMSAGLLLVEDPNGTTVDSILHAADQAMYTAKVSGKRRVSMAEPNGGDSAPEDPNSTASRRQPPQLSLVGGRRQARGC